MLRIILACLLTFGLCPVVSAQTNQTTTQAKTILVLGDSIAAGYGLEPTEAFPALLQKEIQKRHWNFKVINAGVSGDTTAGGLRRLDWLLRQKVDILLLELGGNDGLRGIQPEATKTNLQAIINRSRAINPAMEIVIAGMKMPSNMGAEFTKKFENVFIDLSRENKTALVPFLLEGVGGRADLNLPDRIHPTAKGHQIVAENVWKVLLPVLERIQKAGAKT